MIYSLSLKKLFSYFILAFILIAPFIYGVGDVNAQNCSNVDLCGSGCSSGQRCQTEVICKDDTCGGCAAGNITRKKCVTDNAPTPTPACSGGVVGTSGFAPTGTIEPGTRNITWNAVPNATHYSMRINDNTNPAFTYSSNPCTGTNGDTCNDNVSTNSYSYNFIAGHSYGIWVHARDCAGAWGAATAFNVNVAADLACPAGFSVSCGASGTSATINWNDLSGASQYMVRVNREPYGDWANTSAGDASYYPTASTINLSINASTNYKYDIQGIKSGESYPFAGARCPFSVFSCAPAATFTPVPPTATYTPIPPTKTPTPTPTPTIAPVSDLAMDVTSPGYVSGTVRNYIVAQQKDVRFTFSLPDIAGACGTRSFNGTNFQLVANDTVADSAVFTRKTSSQFQATDQYVSTGTKSIKVECFEQGVTKVRTNTVSFTVIAPTPTPTNTPTPIPPTNTPSPTPTATNTPVPTRTHTPVPPTNTPTPVNGYFTIDTDSEGFITYVQPGIAHVLKSSPVGFFFDVSPVAIIASGKCSRTGNDVTAYQVQGITTGGSWITDPTIILTYNRNSGKMTFPVTFVSDGRKDVRVLCSDEGILRLITNTVKVDVLAPTPIPPTATFTPVPPTNTPTFTPSPTPTTISTPTPTNAPPVVISPQHSPTSPIVGGSPVVISAQAYDLEGDYPLISQVDLIRSNNDVEVFPMTITSIAGSTRFSLSASLESILAETYSYKIGVKDNKGARTIITQSFTAITPTSVPTATFTPVPPTATYTPIPPTATFTPVPPTNTPTPVNGYFTIDTDSEGFITYVQPGIAHVLKSSPVGFFFDVSPVAIIASGKCSRTGNDVTAYQVQGITTGGSWITDPTIILTYNRNSGKMTFPVTFVSDGRKDVRVLCSDEGILRLITNTVKVDVLAPTPIPPTATHTPIPPTNTPTFTPTPTPTATQTPTPTPTIAPVSDLAMDVTSPGYVSGTVRNYIVAQQKDVRFTFSLPDIAGACGTRSFNGTNFQLVANDTVADSAVFTRKTSSQFQATDQYVSTGTKSIKVECFEQGVTKVRTNTVSFTVIAPTPTPTNTPTPIPPTNTPSPTPTATYTPIPPTATFTPVPPTNTPTPTPIPTPIDEDLTIDEDSPGFVSYVGDVAQIIKNSPISFSFDVPDILGPCGRNSNTRAYQVQAMSSGGTWVTDPTIDLTFNRNGRNKMTFPITFVSDGSKNVQVLCFDQEILRIKTSTAKLNTVAPTNTPTPTPIPTPIDEDLTIDEDSPGFVSYVGDVAQIIKNSPISFSFDVPDILGPCGRNSNTRAYQVQAMSSGGTWVTDPTIDLTFNRNGRNKMTFPITFVSDGSKNVQVLCFDQEILRIKTSTAKLNTVAPTNTPTFTPSPTPTATYTPVPTRTHTPIPPTNTPTDTPIPATNTPIPPTATHTVMPATFTPIPATFTPSPTVVYCSRRALGDANCDDQINNADSECWKAQYRNSNAPVGSCVSSDFNADSEVTILDYSIWIITILKERGAS